MPDLDLDYVKDQLFQLISIDSRNPTLTPGAPGEAEIGKYIFKELEGLGLDVKLQETSSPNRLNVIACLPGSAEEGMPSLMLNGHMDTVHVQDMDSPFTPWEQHGLVYGRGSQDMKGSLAVMLGVAESLAKSDQMPPRDLTLAFVVDEEGDSIGTEALAKEFLCEETLVLEPTDLQAAVAHRGFVWYRVVSEGRAAHGSRFEEGIDAIANLGPFLNGLHFLAQDLVKRPPKSLAGPPSLHASTIVGGTELSSYPAKCELLLERRTAPEEDFAVVTKEIQDLIVETNQILGAGLISLQSLQFRSPFQARQDSSLLERLTRIRQTQKLSGTNSISVPFWTDAAILADSGSDCVILGPQGFGLHTTEEWVSLNSLEVLGDILLSLIWDPG